MPKAAVKACRVGHRQNQRWRPEDGCWQCDQAAEQRRLSAVDHSAERAAALAEIGELPASFDMPSRDGKSTIRFTAQARRRRR